MPAQTLSRRTLSTRGNLVQNVLNIPLVYQEMTTQRDVSDLIAPINSKDFLGFKNRTASELLVGAGIGIKAIAPCAINFKIMVTHGEVRVRSYLRLDEDYDLLTPSSAEMTIKAGSLNHIVAEIITIEAVRQMSSLALASFIYL